MNKMNNPFQSLETRLSRIENLLLDLKYQRPKEDGGPEKPMGVKAAAEFLDLKPATIYTKVSKGEIPSVRRGGKLYFFRSVLSEYLQGE